MSEPSSHVVVLGIDPGQTTGIAVLGCELPAGDQQVRWSWPVLVQSSPGGVVSILEMFIERVRDQNGHLAAVAIEQFVTGPRSAKLATPRGAQAARELIGSVWSLAQAKSVPSFLNSAGAVKPWATDNRLDALRRRSGAPVQRGMPHATDALRHALFVGVRYAGMTDPLSRRGSVDHRPEGGSVAMLPRPDGGAPQHPDRGS